MIQHAKSPWTWLLFALLGGCAAPRSSPTAAPADLERYHLLWSTPSADASGSVPVGNGELGANVWIEPDGELAFYLSRTDALSEASRVLKLAKVRVRLTPNPLADGAAFRQELALRDGALRATLGDTELELFVDANAPVLHVRGHSATPREVAVVLDVWRNERRELLGSGPTAERTSSWTMHQGGDGGDTDVRVFESGDVVLDEPQALAWYHRNDESVVPFSIQHQGLEAARDAVVDPLTGRTFGGVVRARGDVAFERRGARELVGLGAREFELSVATHSAVCPDAAAWRGELAAVEARADELERARERTSAWWHDYWARSWVFVEGDGGVAVPRNSHPLRIGVNAAGGERFDGRILRASVFTRALRAEEVASLRAAPRDEPAPHIDGCAGSWGADELREPLTHAGELDFTRGLSFEAWIDPGRGAGRIFDKLTPGGSDGVLFDTHPGRSLRLIVGGATFVARDVLTPAHAQHVAATVDALSGAVAIYLDGTCVYERPASRSSAITRAYTLQRWVNACGGRGEFPIKFNGSIFTVEPGFTDIAHHDADWRRWGDCHWWQNLRLPYHAMLAAGDFEQMDALWRLYERARPIAERRTELHHNARGAYFPETMTVFGLYSNGDYGWNRAGREPSEVLCPWWDHAWNQGLELVALMLDRYDYTGDEAFLRERVLPMAESVLTWFDTRFPRDAQGRLRITPTQSLETYWTDVVDDMPSVAGLIAVTRRLCALDPKFASPRQRALFETLSSAAGELPMQTRDGVRQLAPAREFAPQRSNCESPELYAVFPFRLCGLGAGELEAARAAYAARFDRFTNGWPQDVQVAALLGWVDQARAGLVAKAQNSHPAYRWPATWGPNFDWLPDQCHGGNLMTTLQLMLLQCEGDTLRVLPAWPREWNAHFKLHAPRGTTIEVEYRDGQVRRLLVDPPERARDVVCDLPRG